ncbi:MAG: DUF3572 domain-containing protein [Alphaproteobacteria bacterium]|nr:DUF3572 domain-containing protein [Alphaproteobacteria bacterium]NCQ66260.1 DUF3572 domain-containing protein [Alphaproteobacteria bacterium]NCT06608.1 DUF3572 domain-containing protein [Alphaproteobacteria bacterium]
MKLAREYAELIAVKAVQYLAQNPDALGGFLAYAGIGPADLKTAISSPEFLAGTLDYMMTDEPILLDFAGTMELSPQDIVKARLCFPGADGEFVCSG